MTRFRAQLRPSNRSESGASLILALALVTVISVALVAGLGFASASFRTVSVIGSQRATAYAADGAMQTAVQTMRTNTGCPAVNTAAVGAQPAAAVACTVVQPATTSTPSYALWSVGTSASETGINFGSTTTLQMNAPVASNTTITAGTLTSSYNVSAKGACTGTITVSAPGVKACSSGTTALADPAFASQPYTAGLTNPNPSPTCAVNNGVLTFGPGYYTNTAEFESPVYLQGGNTCQANFEYFSPGVYYFDFGFDSTYPDNVWNVAGMNVTGGQPKGFNPNAAGSLPNQPNPPVSASTNCKTASDGATAGVQFIFGGASQMTVNQNSGIVELCADPTVTGQQIAIYGQRTGAATTTNLTQVPTTTATQTPASSWTNPLNTSPISPSLTTIDGKYGVDPIASGATETLALNGYVAPIPLIPSGAVNVSAVLKVAHAETVASAPANVVSLTATIGSSACSFAATPHTTSTSTVTLVTDTIAVPTSSACVTALSSNFVVNYKMIAKSGATFTENLDGIDLVVTYTMPAVRAESGCTIVVNSCSVLTVGGTQAKFVSWGTVYTPLSSVTVNVGDTADVANFRRGLVARSISIPNPLPPYDSTGTFCLAAGSPCTGSTGGSLPRIELLTVSVSGSVELRALVSYIDTPSVGTSLQILSWNVIR